MHLLWLGLIPAVLFVTFSVMRGIYELTAEGIFKNEWYSLPLYLTAELIVAAIGMGSLIAVAMLSTGSLI